MRLAFMSFACPTASLAEMLTLAQDLGFAALEPRLDSGHAHGLEVGLDRAGRVAARRQLMDADVDLCCLATSLRFVQTDPAARQALVAAVRARAELAADLGAPALRVFGGPLLEGLTDEQADTVAADTLREAAVALDDLEIELWLETHDTFSLGRRAADVVTRVDHPAVGINYDVLHPFRLGESRADTLGAVGPYLRHVHWHDGLAQPGGAVITRFGEGDLPLTEILAGLRQWDYAGYLSGEWFDQQLGPSPRASLMHYRDAVGALLAGT